MRAKTVLGLLLVAAGGLLVLFAPAAPADEPLRTASVDAPAPPEAAPEESEPSLLLMALGAVAGLAGLVLLARTLEPRDLE